MSTSVSANLAQVRKRIELACLAAERPANAVHLLAVSKTMPAQAVRDAYAAGQVAFGENYICLLYTSPSPRDGLLSRMPSSA